MSRAGAHEIEPSRSKPNKPGLFVYVDDTNWGITYAGATYRGEDGDLMFAGKHPTNGDFGGRVRVLNGRWIFIGDQEQLLGLEGPLVPASACECQACGRGNRLRIKKLELGPSQWRRLFGAAETTGIDSVGHDLRYDRLVIFFRDSTFPELGDDGAVPDIEIPPIERAVSAEDPPKPEPETQKIRVVTDVRIEEMKLIVNSEEVTVLR